MKYCLSQLHSNTCYFSEKNDCLNYILLQYKSVYTGLSSQIQDWSLIFISHSTVKTFKFTSTTSQDLSKMNGMGMQLFSPYLFFLNITTYPPLLWSRAIINHNSSTKQKEST